MKNNFHLQERSEFRARVNQLLHPGSNIELPAQLKGRLAPLSNMQDCFETTGHHAFIWGPRGVGKTSLGHTACEKFRDQVVLSSAVACERSTSFPKLMKDIALNAIQRDKSILSNKDLQFSLSLFGLKAETKFNSITGNLNIEGPNEAVRFLEATFNPHTFHPKVPAIIIDEFDLLENKETLEALTNTIKQMSVSSTAIKFIFCGVAKNLEELLGAHESVERYVYSVELFPLSHDAIWEIINDIESEFQISFHRGQKIRISQISSGYAHFAHLILKNILLEMFEQKISSQLVPESVYKNGISRSADQAATRLKKSYDDAVKKGTDRYIEVLWALANSQHLDRQFKDICADYKKIIEQRPHRNGYDVSKNNGQDIRNSLENLKNRGFLTKGRTGWYQFMDPMLRSYVRMVAERDGVELSDESFPA